MMKVFWRDEEVERVSGWKKQPLSLLSDFPNGSLLVSKYKTVKKNITHLYARFK